jgi:hypothetical protein
VGIENHRNEDDEVAEENSEHGFPPIHAAADERRGEHIGGNAGGHGNPERGEAEHSPFAPGSRDGCEVRIEETALLNVRLDIRGIGRKAR